MAGGNTVHSRRSYLKAVSALGLGGLAGCTMTQGSIDPTMGSVMGVEGLSMFKGAPAHGEYPAAPQTMSMEGMEMEGVMVRMVAASDDSNNYHFMPHVAWIEPGTTVIWAHADIEGVSEPRTHTVTSFGGARRYPRLIPEEASHFDSGFIAGLHGVKPDKGIDERFNGIISRRLSAAASLPRGPFTHTFEEEGVYMYYCQNHHGFKMAGAIVVGELWGEGGTGSVSDPSGWAPAMTTEATDQISEIDPIGGQPLQDQVHEVRELVHGGGEAMGGHG